MIKIYAFDDDDALREIEGIKRLVKSLQDTIMKSQFCHIKSESCRECKFKEICFDCEELEIWCVNQYQYMEGVYDGKK